jgi:tRNA pseudouridine38-40 synthase
MRIAIGVAYRGTDFDGWQTQPSGRAVQDALERALSEIAGHPVALTAAGRTDAGVHASAQVAHFDASAERPDSAWVRGANTLLPDTVSVQWAMRVADDFHARYSATGRSYRYVLYRHPVRPALLSGLVGWFHGELDAGAMRRAAEHLLGEHDFSAFRSSECQAKSPVRVLERADVSARGPYLLLDFAANAFLHHMVRNIVGCLVYVGNGRQPPEWIAELMQKRDRRLAAPTFSPDGLYLSGVRYDARWNLPGFPRMMPFDPEPER